MGGYPIPACARCTKASPSPTPEPSSRGAKVAMILLHGRGASAEDILSLAQAFAQPEIAYFAPQAAGHSWYPHSFSCASRG